MINPQKATAIGDIWFSQYAAGFYSMLSGGDPIGHVVKRTAAELPWLAEMRTGGITAQGLGETRDQAVSNAAESLARARRRLAGRVCTECGASIAGEPVAWIYYDDGPYEPLCEACDPLAPIVPALEETGLE